MLLLREMLNDYELTKEVNTGIQSPIVKNIKNAVFWVDGRTDQKFHDPVEDFYTGPNGNVPLQITVN